jgi:hypothetical protein
MLAARMLNRSAARRPYPEDVDRLSAQIALVLGAFAAGAALAELFGASSLGIAFGFGQIAFSLTLGFVLLRL